MEMRVNNLTCARGGAPVLAGVSFAVQAGQALVIRGPNGVGKTTLLRTLAGLQPALRGDVSVHPGEIAFATHADGVKSAMTVAENLRFWAAMHGTSDHRQAIAAMNLQALTNRRRGSCQRAKGAALGWHGFW